MSDGSSGESGAFQGSGSELLTTRADCSAQNKRASLRL